MRSAASLTLMLAALLPRSAPALQILQPESIRGTYPSTEAMFGTPRYGSSLVAQLVYFETDSDGCEPFSRKKLQEIAPGDEPVIVLVERGSCTFVQKVRDVEYMARARAVVVFDNKQEHAFAMADDGTGSDISIPSVMVDYEDGVKLRNATTNGTDRVMASIEWDIPAPDDHVEWQLWSSSNDLSDAESFKLEFAPVSKALELTGDVSFAPRFFFFNGSMFGCLQERPTVKSTGYACGRQCTNDGRYCTEDPDGSLRDGLDGGDIIQENLRQICIREQLTPLNETWRWWDYVRGFHTKCMPENPDTNATARVLIRAQCSAAQQAAAGINVTAVEACVVASGGSPYNGGENTLLNKELADRKDAHVYNFPDVRINKKDYAGTWACPNTERHPRSLSTCPVLAAICDGLPDGADHRPAPCHEGYCWGETDACGVCDGDNSTCCVGGYDCNGVCNGPYSFDKCNTCLLRNSTVRCELCKAPDGAVIVAANAGECVAAGGKWVKQGSNPGANLTPPSATDHTGAIVGVALAAIAGLVGVLVLARRHARNREDALRRDFAEILSNYVPLDTANAQAGGRGGGVVVGMSAASSLSGTGGKARRAMGKGLAKLAGKRTSNPVVQHANDDEGEGEWAGGGDATFDDEDLETQMAMQPAITDTV